MGRAKEIIIKVIPSKLANEFVKEHHYSKSYVQNSVLHFGCFLDNKLHGVLQYGNSMDKRNVLPLVDTGMDMNEGWNSMLELNRMVFTDYLPKNSESRCIGITLKMIRKKAPHIKWILSYADGTQCGDGTIYRASGFKLTKINKNVHIAEMPDGTIVVKHGNQNTKGAINKEGYQFRYIYLLDKSCKITVPILSFDEIDKVNGGMYKGEKITIQERKLAKEA